MVLLLEHFNREKCNSMQRDTCLLDYNVGKFVNVDWKVLKKHNFERAIDYDYILASTLNVERIMTMEGARMATRFM